MNPNPKLSLIKKKERMNENDENKRKRNYE